MFNAQRMAMSGREPDALNTPFTQYFDYADQEGCAAVLLFPSPAEFKSIFTAVSTEADLVRIILEDAVSKINTRLGRKNASENDPFDLMICLKVAFIGALTDGFETVVSTAPLSAEDCSSRGDLVRCSVSRQSLNVQNTHYTGLGEDTATLRNVVGGLQVVLDQQHISAALRIMSRAPKDAGVVMRISADQSKVSINTVDDMRGITVSTVQMLLPTYNELCTRYMDYLDVPSAAFLSSADNDMGASNRRPTARGRTKATAMQLNPVRNFLQWIRRSFKSCDSLEGYYLSCTVAASTPHTGSIGQEASGMKYIFSLTLPEAEGWPGSTTTVHCPIAFDNRDSSSPPKGEVFSGRLSRGHMRLLCTIADQYDVECRRNKNLQPRGAASPNISSFAATPTTEDEADDTTTSFILDECEGDRIQQETVLAVWKDVHGGGGIGLTLFPRTRAAEAPSTAIDDGMEPLTRWLVWDRATCLRLDPLASHDDEC